MNSLRFLRFALIIASMLVLASCATQPAPEAIDPPGFFSGLWHGLTIFFSLIGHLFDHSIRVYAFPNSGGWYDFGFFLGLGGLGVARRGKKASRRVDNQEISEHEEGERDE